MANNFGRVNVSVTASTGGLTAGLANASKQTSKFAAQIARISLATTFTAATTAVSILSNTLRSAYGTMRQFVEAAVSLGEETSKSAVIFGKSAAAVSQFARSAKSIGISEVAALQATGTFGNLFRAIGLTRDQSAEYSVTLTSLAADLASFNNASISDALMALGAGLRGEAEPLRRFGVLLDDATLRQNALAMGLTKSLKTALTPSQKAQAAYNAILRQTSLAQGDFTRTSGSLANQQRILSANFANLSSELGQAFLPLFQQVTAALIGAMPEIKAIALQLSQFVTGATSGFGDATSAANTFKDALRGISTEMARIKGIEQVTTGLTSWLLGMASQLGRESAQVMEWLSGSAVRNQIASIRPGMGIDAPGANKQTLAQWLYQQEQMFYGAAKSLLSSGVENLRNPDSGFNAALAQAAKGAQAAAGGGAKQADPLAGAIGGVATNAMDMLNRYGMTALTLTREAAAGFTRAAIGGLQQQSSKMVSESLQAIVAGTSEAEAFQNRMARGYDPRRVENDASRTANATEQTVTVLNQIEALFNRLDLGLASIGV